MVSNAEPFIYDIRIDYIIYDAVALPTRNPIEDDYQFSFTRSISGSSIDVQAISFDSETLDCGGSGCQQECIDRTTCQNYGGEIFDNLCVVCGPNEKI